MKRSNLKTGQVSNLADADSPSLNKYHLGRSFSVGPISGILLRRWPNRCWLDGINSRIQRVALLKFSDNYKLGIELITISLDLLERWQLLPPRRSSISNEYSRIFREGGEVNPNELGNDKSEDFEWKESNFNSG